MSEKDFYSRDEVSVEDFKLATIYINWAAAYMLLSIILMGIATWLMISASLISAFLLDVLGIIAYLYARSQHKKFKKIMYRG